MRIKSVPFLIVDILGKVVSGIQNSAIIKGGGKSNDALKSTDIRFKE